jgi:hypothetical protein
MISMPYVADRNMVDVATDLIADLGKAAAPAAAARADQSRVVGNVTQFCRWRQVERLIVVLSSTKAVATVH